MKDNTRLSNKEYIEEIAIREAIGEGKGEGEGGSGGWSVINGGRSRVSDSL